MNIPDQMIRCETCASGLINSSLFTNGLRALFIKNSKFNITNSLFSYLGTETSNGGAILSQNSNLTSYDSVFDNNLGLNGGAIFPSCINVCTFAYY